MRRVTLQDQSVRDSLQRLCVLYSHDTGTFRVLPSERDRPVDAILESPTKNRRLLRRGEGGENFWSCFCDTNGVILHWVAGFLSPEDFLTDLALAEFRAMECSSQDTRASHARPRSGVRLSSPRQFVGTSVKPFLEGVWRFPLSSLGDEVTSM